MFLGVFMTAYPLRTLWI